MKVIGMQGDDYIAVVKHSELERMSNKYGYRESVDKLKIGSEMDLGQGYDFRADIKQACASMQSAMEKFEQARATMHRFAIMVAEQPTEGGKQ